VNPREVRQTVENAGGVLPGTSLRFTDGLRDPRKVFDKCV